jgi:hypothetical protein
VSGQIYVRWVAVKPVGRGDKHLLPGLRAGIDKDGTVWAWAGLLQSKAVSLLMAADDGEPLVLDGGEPYLRTAWMRENLVTEPRCSELLDLLEMQVLKCRSH